MHGDMTCQIIHVTLHVPYSQKCLMPKTVNVFMSCVHVCVCKALPLLLTSYLSQHSRQIANKHANKGE